jgi:hypothetical protein
MTAGQPFLQVLTRCYRRPQMLMTNMAGLTAQSDPDWEQTLLVDGEGRGIGAAQAALANLAPYVRGQYIWIVDDDDCCIRPTLVAECKAIAAEHEPDVIMVRMDHGPRGILPDDAHWHKPPVLSWIGCSAYIVRRAVWQRHAHVFTSATYNSDFDFIAAVFASDPDLDWHDVVASAVQRISLGKDVNAEIEHGLRNA